MSWLSVSLEQTNTETTWLEQPFCFANNFLDQKSVKDLAGCLVFDSCSSFEVSGPREYLALLRSFSLILYKINHPFRVLLQIRLLKHNNLRIFGFLPVWLKAPGY